MRPIVIILFFLPLLTSGQSLLVEKCKIEKMVTIIHSCDSVINAQDRIIDLQQGNINNLKQQVQIGEQIIEEQKKGIESLSGELAVSNKKIEDKDEEIKQLKLQRVILFAALILAAIF
jgi:septal ring factor EnvC (AmiA/AmiB activator)